jgi:hypothetical protein
VVCSIYYFVCLRLFFLFRHDRHNSEWKFIFKISGGEYTYNMSGEWSVDTKEQDTKGVFTCNRYFMFYTLSVFWKTFSSLQIHHFLLVFWQHRSSQTQHAFFVVDCIIKNWIYCCFSFLHNLQTFCIFFLLWESDVDLLKESWRYSDIYPKCEKKSDSQFPHEFSEFFFWDEEKNRSVFYF